MTTWPVLLLDFDDGPSGAVEVQLSTVNLPEQARVLGRRKAVEARRRLTASEVRRRADILSLALERRQRYPGVSFVLGDLQKDASSLAVEMLWQLIRSWDWEHVIAPVAEILIQALPLVLIYRGDSMLPHFSPRMAIRAAIQRGAAPLDLLGRIVCVPFWWPSGLLRLLERIDREHALPAVHAPDATLLLGPEPPSALVGVLESRGMEECQALLRDGWPEVEIHRYNSLLRSQVISNALGAGVAVVSSVTREVLLEQCGPVSEGGTLFVIAHQDEAGLHLEDGVLELAELRAELRARRASRAPCYDTVDLAVCGADAPRNLAACFQAVGTPVVMTHGAVAFYGRALASLAATFRRLVQLGPRPLPLLADEAWMDLVGCQPSSDGGGIST